MVPAERNRKCRRQRDGLDNDEIGNVLSTTVAGENAESPEDDYSHYQTT